MSWSALLQRRNVLFSLPKVAASLGFTSGTTCLSSAGGDDTWSKQAVVLRLLTY